MSGRELHPHRAHAAGRPSQLHRLGAGLSIACAVHCLAMPLLVGVLPILGLSFLAEEATETWLVGITLSISIAGALWGFQRHRARPIVTAIVAAAGLVLFGRWLGEAHPMGLPLTIGGAVIIAVAHLRGARLCRACPGEH